MNLVHLGERINLKEVQLIQHLKKLKISGLVEKHNFGKNKIFFEVTDSGTAALKIFRPLISNASNTQMKNFEKIIIPA
jgi:hypothetical protein